MSPADRTDDEPLRTATTAGDRSIVYAEYGTPDGRPVLFLHGTPGSHRLAGAFDDVARDRGVRLLAPDRPGYGRSDPWPGRSIADCAAVVDAVLADAGVDRAPIVGFSGGGPAALATAAERPALVETVHVLAGATPPSVSESDPPITRLFTTLARHAPTVLALGFRAQARLVARLDPSVVVDQYTADDASGTVPDAVARTVQDDFLEAVRTTASGVATDFRNVGRPWPIDFEAIEQPVTVWHGRRDTNVPVGDVRSLVERLPTAELSVQPDADHLRTLLWCLPEVLER